MKLHDAILEFCKTECFSQKDIPLLTICDRFAPDTPLHGKCSSIQALLTALFDFLSSSDFSAAIFHALSETFTKLTLNSVSRWIQSCYIDEEKDLTFRIVGNDADIFLRNFMDIVNVIQLVPNFSMTTLMDLKLRAFSFICGKVHAMSEIWEVLDMSKEENPENIIDEFSSFGKDSLTIFSFFFPESNITPWMYTLCIDAPYFMRKLMENHGVGLGAASCQNGEK